MDDDTGGRWWNDGIVGRHGFRWWNGRGMRMWWWMIWWMQGVGAQRGGGAWYVPCWPLLVWCRGQIQGWNGYTMNGRCCCGWGVMGG